MAYSNFTGLFLGGFFRFRSQALSMGLSRVRRCHSGGIFFSFSLQRRLNAWRAGLGVVFLTSFPTHSIGVSVSVSMSMSVPHTYTHCFPGWHSVHAFGQRDSEYDFKQTRRSEARWVSPQEQKHGLRFLNQSTNRDYRKSFSRLVNLFSKYE